MTAHDVITDLLRQLAAVNERILISECSDNLYALSGRMNADYAYKATLVKRLEQLEGSR